ncbi:MAG TPA: hypothetical protein VHY20_05545, partial [Pirellulales bacterium]|nr:hypothetical protein [Pirellulales bacterium]
RTFAGPQLAALPRSTDGTTTMKLSSVDSASLLLIARDHSPLLSIEGPSTGSPGSTIRIGVTCYNPSPKAVAGSIGLEIPADWTRIGPAPRVKIPARGRQTVQIAVHLGSATGRSVVTATFSQGWSTPQVASVPIDVMVTSAGPS